MARRATALLFGVLAIAACSGPPDISEPSLGVITLSGSVAIPDAGTNRASPPPSVPAPCTGDGAHSDIHEGTAIVVRDGAGTILQSGALGPGEARPGSERQSCWFAFQVPAIPLGANFYTVQVADRAVRIYSADQLDADAWDIVIEPAGSG